MSSAVPLVATSRGTGPLVLMLHGIGGSRTAWDRQIALLQDDYTCLAPDFAGYGDSPDAVADGLDPIIESLARLLDGRRAHVIAVSFGALCALALARTHPYLVRSLVLADATLGRGADAPDARKHWLEQRRVLANDLVKRSLERAAIIASPTASADVISEIAHHMRRARPAGYMAVAATIAAADARPWLQGIDLPALVICGEHDGVTGIAVSRELACSLTGAKLATIGSAGHAPHIEQPAEFATIVRAFMVGIDDTSAAPGITWEQEPAR